MRLNPATLADLPAPPGAEAVMPLPSWWPKKKAYHGTYDDSVAAIQREGFCCPPAHECSDRAEYGWERLWKGEVYKAYREKLDDRQRRAFHAHLGLATGGRRSTLVTADEIGERVSLFWVSRDQGVANRYEAVTEVDLSQLRYYFWFEDTSKGRQSYVFVLPRACPQAPGTILKPAEFEPPPVGEYAYLDMSSFIVDGTYPRTTKFYARSRGTLVRPDEAVVSSDPRSLFERPVARFPWPGRKARLVDARFGLYAVKARALDAVEPDSIQVNYDPTGGSLDDESQWEALPESKREMRARTKAANAARMAEIEALLSRTR